MQSKMDIDHFPSSWTGILIWFVCSHGGWRFLFIANHEKHKMLSIDMKCPHEYPHLVCPVSMAPLYGVQNAFTGPCWMEL